MEQTIIAYLYEFNDYKLKCYPFVESDLCIVMKLTPELIIIKEKSAYVREIHSTTKNQLNHSTS